MGWIARLYEAYRQAHPELPSFEAFWDKGYAELDLERRVVPVATMGKAISLRVQNLGQDPTVVKQIETPRLLPPSCGGQAPTAKRSV